MLTGTGPLGEKTMTMRLYVLLTLILLLGTGCATLTQGSSQTITVATDPAGANCALSRDGTTVAVINPTPGSIPVGKASGTISVLCKHAGYQDSAGVLASEFQAMTFGNILFGGLIGLAVDAASGAMNKYPDMVTITMVPEEFDSAEARDKFFGAMQATLLRESAEVKDRIAKVCKPENCASELAAADAGTQSRMADIEQRRLLARVRTTG
jgi:hypothetical protein